MPNSFVKLSEVRKHFALLRREMSGVKAGAAQIFSDKYGIVSEYGVVSDYGIVSEYGVVSDYGIVSEYGVVNDYGFIVDKR